MFNTIKKFFTRAIDLSSSFFQESEIVFKKPSVNSDLVPSEIQINKEKPLPKIKRLKQNSK
jgi:hypothetical protein